MMDKMNLPAILFSQTWQLTVLIGIVWCLTRCFTKNRPHLAHALWVIVLLKCVTPPLWSSPFGLFSWMQAKFGTQEVVLDLSRSDQAAWDPAIDTPSQGTAIHSLDAFIASNDSSADISIVGTPALPRQSRSLTNNGSVAFDLASVRENQARTSTFGVTWAIRFWLVGIAVFLGVFTLRWYQFLRRLHRARQPVSAEHVDLLKRLKHRLGIRSRVQLAITDSRIGPAVIGLIRPTILLPTVVVAGKSPQEIEPLLAHELIHIRRGDLWLAAVQTVAQSLWWFHPIVWMLSRWITRESERCCDEEVIARLGCSPAVYARGLIEVLERKHSFKAVPVFPGVRPVDVTSNRLERIMRLGQGSRKRSPWWCWAVIIVGCAIALPGAAAILTAQTSKNRPVERNRLDQKSDTKLATEVLATRASQSGDMDDSTSQRLEAQLMTRLYDVAQVLPIFYTLPDIVLTEDGQSRWTAKEKSHSPTIVHGAIQSAVDEIYSLIDDGSWERDGGDGQITTVDKTLSMIITQKQSNHKRIAEYIRRQARHKSDLIFVDGERVSVTIPGGPGSISEYLNGFVERTPNNEMIVISQLEKAFIKESMLRPNSGTTHEGPRLTLSNGMAANLLFNDRGKANVRLKWNGMNEKIPILQVSIAGKTQTFAIEKGNSIVFVSTSETTNSGWHLDLIILSPRAYEEEEELAVGERTLGEKASAQPRREGIPRASVQSDEFALAVHSASQQSEIKDPSTVPSVSRSQNEQVSNLSDSDWSKLTWEELSERRKSLALSGISKPDSRVDPLHRYPIMGPLLSGKNADFAPPSDQEVMAVFANVFPSMSEVHRLYRLDPNSIRVDKTFLASHSDPPRFVPLIGFAILHHATYKCSLTVTDPSTEVGKAAAIAALSGARHELYVDSNQFLMVGKAESERATEAIDRTADSSRVFYSGGLLPGGEWPIRSETGLNVVDAIMLVIEQTKFSLGDIKELSLASRGLFILRKVPGNSQVTIRVDLAKAIDDPTERPLIQPGDTLILKDNRTDELKD